jgi:hypothetical protein
MPSAARLRLEMRQKKAGDRDAPVDCNPHEKDTAGRGLGSRKEDASRVEGCCGNKGKLYDQSVSIQSRTWVLSMGVAQPQACHRPHRWTTAELWSAGRGGPRESKRHEHGGVSHGHWPCAPKTVPSPSWMQVYIGNICGVQSIVADTSPLRKPPYGVDATVSPPQPRDEMVIGHEGRRPHPVGIAPVLIR